MHPLLELWSTDVPAGADSWESIRRPPRHSDEALTGTARLWLRKLPTGRRPERLCMLYPRIANRIAWVWRDTALTEALLDDLLTDRRGGRQGFPKAVVLELRRLRDFSARLPAPDHAPGYMDALRHFWSRH